MACTNSLSITTLNAQRFLMHVNDILQDEDLLGNMILCFQETRSDFLPRNNEFGKFDFSFTYLVHGVIFCIHKNIETTATKTLCNNKIELVMSDLNSHPPIFLMNKYVAPIARVSIINETIATTKMKLEYRNCIFLIIGDFNIDIHVNNHRSKQLIDYMQ
jgi:hypothetical protein